MTTTDFRFNMHLPPVYSDEELQQISISNIFHKLQVADRAQAIVKARNAGFGREN